MLKQMIVYSAKLMEVLGVSVIILGALFSIIMFFIDTIKKNDSPYDTLRKRLGRSILLGLEFLVAGDIISTVAIKPTISTVVVLAVIVIIRTFLSFSLQIELEKKLPWRQVKDKN